MPPVEAPQYGEEGAIHGTCVDCGDVGKIYEDCGRCEDCDSNHYHCEICDSDEHRDSLCRHLFEEDGTLEMHGSGTGRAIDDNLKSTIFKLFKLMPDGFPEDLRVAIGSGFFHTFLVAPMIGGGGMLEMNGMPNRDGKWMHFEWGKSLLEIGRGDEAEETADAYHWLASLYNDKTPVANAATVAVIGEYLEAK